MAGVSTPLCEGSDRSRTLRHPAGLFLARVSAGIDRIAPLVSSAAAGSADAHAHMLLMGATGSGKTVTLLSLCSNALTWGSGFFYSDGKADNSLHAAVW